MNKFFNALKTKTSVTPSSEFDRSFWSKFNAEFPEKPEKSGTFSFFDRPIFFPGLVSFATAAALVICVGVLHKSHIPSPALIPSEEMAAVSKKDMLTHIEMLKAFESLPGGLPVSDEDWSILLPEGVPAS